MSELTSTVAQIAEEAWQLNQKFLHADYLGYEPDLFQLRGDLAFLSLLIHQLAEEVDDAAKRLAEYGTAETGVDSQPPSTRPQPRKEDATP